MRSRYLVVQLFMGKSGFITIAISPLAYKIETLRCHPMVSCILETGTCPISQRKGSHKHLFIHEMVHVWQYQRGMWVKTRGLYSWLANYSYELDGSKLLKNYAMEQQAQIVADYHLLTSSGYAVWRNRFGKEVTYSGNDYADVRKVKEKYEKVLVGFPYK